MLRTSILLCFGSRISISISRHLVHYIIHQHSYRSVCRNPFQLGFRLMALCLLLSKHGGGHFRYGLWFHSLDCQPGQRIWSGAGEIPIQLISKGVISLINKGFILQPDMRRRALICCVVAAFAEARSRSKVFPAKRLQRYDTPNTADDRLNRETVEKWTKHRKACSNDAQSRFDHRPVDDRSEEICEEHKKEVGKKATRQVNTNKRYLPV